MTRLLIAASAVGELRAVEPLARRRALVTRLSRLGPAGGKERLCAPGLHRANVHGAQLLYRCRGDGATVIVGISVEAGPEAPGSRRGMP